MKAEDQFHVGIVVDDLDHTLGELTALLGYEWCEEVDVETPVQLPAGETTVRFRFRYSRTAPRLELIQAQPGTLWTPAPGSGIHHLGYWSDDVDADGAALERSGYALEAAGGTWAYHRNPNGPRIELVSRTLEPMMSMWWQSS